MSSQIVKTGRSRRHLPLVVSGVLAALALAGPVAASSAATGGPDEGGYTFTDSTESGGPAAGFVDVSATGSPLGILCDDCTRPLALPFPVTVYGTTVTAVVVSSNGTLQVPGGSTNYDNGSFPTAALGTTLAPYWDDLVTNRSPGDDVFTQVSGAAGSRQLVVQWKADTYDGTLPVSFEVVLHEGRSDLEFRYGAVAQGGASASTGIQRDAAAGLTYSDRTPVLAAGLAVAFTTPPQTSALTLAVAPEAGLVYSQPGTVTATVVSAGTGTGTPTGTLAFSTVGGPIVDPVPLSADGRATFSTALLDAGTRTVIARYSGDATHTAAFARLVVSIGLAQVSPRLLLTRGASIVYGDRVAVRIHTDAPATAVLPDSVRVYTLVDGVFAGDVTNRAHGAGVVPHVSLPAGTHSVRLCSLATANIAGGCQAARSVTVTQAAAVMTLTTSADPAPAGTTVTLTATVNPRPVHGAVSFVVDGVAAGESVLSQGTATLVVASLTAGPHTVVATFGGDPNVSAGSVTSTQTVS